MKVEKTYAELIAQIEELENQLNESHDIIDAIRKGEVDAFVLKNDNNKHELYTLKTADHTYRVFIEKMADGAITINKDGLILYCNSSFANMVNIPIEKLLGSSFIDWIPEQHKNVVGKMIENAWTRETKQEINLVANNTQIPVLLSLNTLDIDEGIALSIIVTDLSFRRKCRSNFGKRTASWKKLS
jgi:PAS domain S-box-containing protein